MNIPMVSAVMRNCLQREAGHRSGQAGGRLLVYGSQSIEARRPWCPRSFKKGFVTSDSNLSPEATLADVLALKAKKTGHSTVAYH